MSLWKKSLAPVLCQDFFTTTLNSNNDYTLADTVADYVGEVYIHCQPDGNRPLEVHTESQSAKLQLWISNPPQDLTLKEHYSEFHDGHSHHH